MEVSNTKANINVNMKHHPFNLGENRIQKAAVDIIIDSAVDALLQDPSRRFIYVETAFFSKWWNDQDEELKDQVRMLVKEGRLGTSSVGFKFD